MSTLFMQDIEVSFKGPGIHTPVLCGASLGVQSGQIVCIMGPSGAGKSTLLATAGLLQAPDSGIVNVGGVETSGLSEDAMTRLRADKIGFVFQQANLIPHLTVLENVAIPLLARQWKVKVDAAKSLLKSVGLEGHMDKLPSQISGGQAQRVSLCRALARQPSLIIADEPTSSLDAKSSGQIRLLLEDAARKRGIAVLVATHDEATAAWSDKVFDLVDGTLRLRAESSSGSHAKAMQS